MRRSLVVVLSLALLSGCAISPPPPPQPAGDYHPVNRDQYILKSMDDKTIKPSPTPPGQIIN